MKSNFDGVVQLRVLRQKHFQDWRRTVHNLRRLVAGDKSVLGLGLSQEEGQKPDTEEGLLHDVNGDEFYNVVPTSVTDGLSNHMWQTIKTFAMQVSYRMPEIDFENLSAEESAMNTAYLKRILGTGPQGCNAVDHMRLALIDYLIGAVGFVMVEVGANGRPAIRCVDSLDLTWDVSQPLITDIGWVSRKVRRPLWEWIEMYGKKPFSSMDVEKSYDNMVELEFYYDVHGAEGHHYVLQRGATSHTANEVAIIDQGVNPFYAEASGARIPFLPVEPIYFMQLPSVRFPMGLVQNMIAHQIPIWKMEENFRETIRRGAPFFAVEQGAMSDEDFKRFRSGDIATIIHLLSGKGPPVAVPGLEIRESDMAYYRHHYEQVISQSGANPYAGGSRVDGVRFSSEVQEIAAAASLTSGVVAKDHAEHWRGIARKVLHTAAAYDRNPYQFTVDDVELKFDPASFPIHMFLQPEADVVVREDSGSFRSRRENVIEASQDIEVALKLATAFPNMLQKAAESYLRARGVQNVAGHLYGEQSQAVSPEAVTEQAI